MRIRVIRGENLASLQAFEVDLTVEPLLGAGLFAITGPTGSGKSTLLDALCLALYDTTPRLDERGGVEIGRAEDEHKLSANDVRNILRRGAGEGFAEVEFVGKDGGIYRSRWTVRRARRKPDGRFQPQSVSIWGLGDDGEWDTLSTDRKTDTLALIADTVGLDFDQFRRSVLLAQGEFDRFLKADAKDRGRLLEAMTGADLYRRLGQGAHERARRARMEVESARARVEGIPVLEPLDRAVLEVTVDQARAWVDAAETRCADLVAARQWYALFETLQRSEDEAEARLDQAQTAQVAGEPVRQRLEDVMAAEPLRDTLRDHDTTARIAAEAEARSTARAAAVERAGAALEAAQVAETRTAEARQAARVGAESHAPALAEARRLDARLEEARRAVSRAEATHVEADRRATETEAVSTAAAAARARHGATVAKAESWLETHRWAGLRQWDRWVAELRGLAADRASVTAAEARVAELKARVDEATAAVGPAMRREREAQDALERARQATQGAPLAEARRALSDAETHLEELADRERRLKTLLDRAREAGRLVHRLEDARTTRELARKRVRAERGRARRQARRVAERTEALSDAERRLRLLRAGAGLAEHRALLVDGQPCPLCGATEHPGVEAEAARATVTVEEAAVADLRAALDDARLEETRATERAAAAVRQGDEAAAIIDDNTRALEALAGDWDLARMGYGADLPESAVGAEASVAKAVDDNHTARDRAEAVRRAARHALDAIEAGREAVDIGMSTLQSARESLAQAREHARTAVTESERAVDTVEAARAAVDARRRTLDGAFSAWPGWPDGAEEPVAFAAEGARWIEAWHTHETEAHTAAEALTVADRQLAESEAAARQRVEAVSEARSTVDAARRELAEIEARRSAVLDGQPVEAAERTIRRAVEQAEAQAGAARDARAAAEAQHASAVEMQAEAEREGTRATRAADDALTLLHEALEGARIDEVTLRDRLSEGPEWVAQTQARLNALKAELKVAEALHGERARARHQHEQTGRPTVDADGISDALALGTDAGRVFRDVLEDARARLRQDGLARDARAELAPQLAEREADFALWARLSDLIGSHDGANFRDFAQSLTLDAVVGLANRHLAELAPRYMLERVPAHDLELQVIDRDMGDEIRSVQSLSGGESFLVSLALALGLASLSAQEAKLESLFIDEGFGTLDDKTLGLALSTLDALQSTGRQIGLISHVPGFAERVGVQVEVVPEGPGRSQVVVKGVGSGV